MESKTRFDLYSWRKLRELLEEREYTRALRLVNKQIRQRTNALVHEEAQQAYDAENEAQRPSHLKSGEEAAAEYQESLDKIAARDSILPDEEGPSGVEATAVT